MTEIVNLRMARKARKRSKAEQDAAAARASHGQTKADRTRQQHEADRITHNLDGARREES